MRNTNLNDQNKLTNEITIILTQNRAHRTSHPREHRFETPGTGDRSIRNSNEMLQFPGKQRVGPESTPTAAKATRARETGWMEALRTEPEGQASISVPGAIRVHGCHPTRKRGDLHLCLLLGGYQNPSWGSLSARGLQPSAFWTKSNKTTPSPHPLNKAKENNTCFSSLVSFPAEGPSPTGKERSTGRGWADGQEALTGAGPEVPRSQVTGYVFSAQNLNQSGTNCFFEKRCLLNNFNCHKMTKMGFKN